MNRAEKLALLKKRKTQSSKQLESDLQVLGNLIKSAADDLRAALGLGVEFKELDKLLDQLSELSITTDQVKLLREAIEKMHLPDSLTVNGLDDLLEKISNLKLPAPQVTVQADNNKAQLSEVADNLLVLARTIKDNSVGSSQKPDDYLPVRRVVKAGNTFVFDDNDRGSAGGSTGRSTPYDDVSGNPSNVTLTAAGKIPVEASLNTTGLATDTNQTSGGQKTQIVDAGGEVATVTGGKLDVNATASLAGDAIPASGATTAVTVQIADGSGNQITSFGGGAQYTEGDTDTTITGTAVLWEDTSDTLSTVKASKPLPVSTGLTQPTTPTDTQPISGTVTVTGVATSTKQSDGSQKTQVVDGSGNVIGATSNALDINIKSGNPTSITANAGTNLNTSALALDATLAGAIKAEDAASADGDKGIPAMAVRKATPANTSGTDGDYENLQMSAGRLWVDASGKTLTVDGSGVTQPVSAATLPLPSGASTSTNQSTLITELKVLNGAVAMQVDDTGTTLYQGWADAGTATSSASWRIRKVVSSGTPTDTSITFADGDIGFNNVWDDRAGLSYS